MQVKVMRYGERKDTELCEIHIPISELPHSGDYLHLKDNPGKGSYGIIVSHVIRTYSDGHLVSAEIIVKE